MFMQDSEIQNILDRVIDGGYYTGLSVQDVSSQYMCLALKYAARADVIAEDEYVNARKLIEEYLPTNIKNSTLRGALIEIGQPSCHADRLRIYRDWANRPALSGQEVNCVAIPSYVWS
ncbi:MAG: hypothetical protein ACRCUH_10190 [Shewanella sp.]